VRALLEEMKNVILVLQKRDFDFNNELNIFAKLLLILREILQIIEKFRIMCYYLQKIFSC